ncbi:MAG: fatty acid CoA ligase family protein [Bacteriovorax sp.]|nr:fatty acid CoA ligase family protein [Bacteriovorax sp.]
MNIASRLSQFAKSTPDKRAVVFPRFNKKKHAYDYSALTFKELDILSNKFALQLLKLGLKSGDNTLLFLKPSLDFSAMTFALFKLGVVPVFIDPGMGITNLLKCIKESGPVGLIAEKQIHFLKYLYPSTFKTVKMNVTNGSFSWGKMISIAKMKQEKIQSITPSQFSPDDTAAILFTSGGTGTPKGVIYTHNMFDQQTSMLQNLYQLTNNDIDMPGFPLFSLFTIAMGMTSCIPDMDPTKPGACNPKKIVQNIIDQKPTFVAGSPAIWERVADYCLEAHITLPTIKYVVMFGAPVSVKLHRKFKPLLPNGTTYTPYGATEALPVSNISGSFVLKHTAQLTDEGYGTCIGLPAPGVEVKIIKITDEVIEQFSTELESPKAEVGEIIIKAQIASREYLNLPDKTHEAKIADTENTFWHRMGDLGYIDSNGLLWFCGRKTHMVITKNDILFPIPCEAIFNKHPAVRRSALVGLGVPGKQIPAIVIERKDGQYLSGKARSLFESELLAVSKKYNHTKDIQKIYLSKFFPVDVRHNIKIDRLKLKAEIEHHEIN